MAVVEDDTVTRFDYTDTGYLAPFSLPSSSTLSDSELWLRDNFAAKIDYVAAPETGAIGGVIRFPGSYSGQITWGGGISVDGSSTPYVGISSSEYQTPLPRDQWVSFLFAWDAVSSEVWVDGALVDSFPVGGLESGSAPFIGAYDSSGNGNLRLIAVGGWDGVGDDWETIAGELAALVPIPPVEILSEITVPAPQVTVSLVSEDMWTDPEPTPLPTPGGSQTPPTPPAPVPPPLDVPDPAIYHVGELMPAPTLVDGWPQNWTASQKRDVLLGRLQIIVEGVDITWFGGVATPFPSWDRAEPFGAQFATITVPALSPFSPRPAWCREGANVLIRLVRPGLDPLVLFSGYYDTTGNSEPEGALTLKCIGTLYQADQQLRPPALTARPQDVGIVISDVLNSTVSRRFKTTSPVITGCLTGISGGWEPRLTGFVQELLATSIQDGKQWTVACDVDQPVIRLKDTDTVSFDIRLGQRGIDVDLESDSPPNVIFGEGVAADGGRWRNCKYPNWRPDDTPPYPGPGGQGMTVGYTDAQSSTGDGVSVWQRKVNRPVTGVLSQQDRVEWRRVQRSAGIQVDNFLGPQTWAATFGTGSNTGSLDGAFIAPLVYLPEVEPFLYSPDGDILGANPEYDSGQIRVEQKYDFGQGVSKTEGTRSAAEILARDSKPGLLGNITFTADPYQISKYQIREGMNGLVRGVPEAGGARDVKLHVSAVSYREDSVTVTVDEKARDYPTVEAVLDRERNATDPAQAIIKRLSRAKVGSDRPAFDAESPAGQVPRHAVFRGLWTVLRIPFGSYGTVARTEYKIDDSPFSLAVFAKPITASQLLSLVGNPLTASENPWDVNADALRDAGLLQAWGWARQPAGYFPMSYSTPMGEEQAPVTGRLEDDGEWEFYSESSPWLWVCEIAGGGTGAVQAQGRFWPGVDN